jgi:uncharacterized protein (DUF2252 family)
MKPQVKTLVLPKTKTQFPLLSSIKSGTKWKVVNNLGGCFTPLSNGHMVCQLRDDGRTWLERMMQIENSCKGQKMLYHLSD